MLRRLWWFQESTDIPGIPCTLGFLLILLGWAAFLSNVLALIVLPAFVLYMNRFQILPEERVLTPLCR